MNLPKFLKGTKRGETNVMGLAYSAIAFVIVALVLSIGATIAANFQDAQVANSTAYNATGYGLTALNTISQQLPTLGLIVVGGAMITILIGAFVYAIYRKQE